MERSETIGQLAKALAAARKDFPPIRKATENPYFNSRYADLSDLIDATKEPLCANGLAVIQLPSASLEHSTVTVTTLLVHSSGEWISGDIAVPAVGTGKDGKEKLNAQTIGSAVSYARRYAYQAALNLGAEDDDGNAASKPARQERAAAASTTVNASRANTPDGVISEGQRRRLFAICKELQLNPDCLKDHIFKTYAFASSKDITRDRYELICAWLQGGGQ